MSAASMPPSASSPTPLNVVDRTNGEFSHGRMSDIRGMIVHHTSGRGTVGGLESTFAQSNVSSHYSVDRDGTVYQHVPPGEVANHMKPGWGDKGNGRSNRNMLGVEVMAANNADVTPQQREAVAQLNARDAKQYGYDPKADVFGHGEVNPGHKEADEGMSSVSRIRSGELSGVAGGGSDAKEFANLRPTTAPTDKITTAALIPPQPVENRSLLQFAGLKDKPSPDPSVVMRSPAQPTQTAALTPPSVVPSREASQATQSTSPAQAPLTATPPTVEASVSSPTLVQASAPSAVPSYSQPSQQVAASTIGGYVGPPATVLSASSSQPPMVSAALTPPTLSAAGPTPKPSSGMMAGLSFAGGQLANAADIPVPTPAVQIADATPAKSDPPSSLAASAPPVASSAATTPPTLDASSSRPLEAAKAQTATPTFAPESKMALGAPTPPTDTPETSDATVKTKTSAATTPPDQAKPFDLLGNLFGDLPSKKGPQNYMPAQQWNLNPANPGVKWASGGFSSFGSN